MNNSHLFGHICLSELLLHHDGVFILLISELNLQNLTADTRNSAALHAAGR